MINKSFQFILFGFLMIPLLGVAQKVPGYLGKRFTLEYNACLFPSFYNPNSTDAEQKAGDDLRQKGVSINYQHNVLGQWSFSKRSSLVASAGFVNTNFIPQKNNYNGFTGGYLKFDKYPEMRATSFNAGIRIFTQHYAPLGKFVEFKLGFATVKTDRFNYSITNGFGIGGTKNYTVDGGSMTWPILGMGLGTSRIIKDIIIVSFGMDFSFFTGGLGRHIGVIGNASLSEFRAFEEGNTSNNQEELLKMAGARYALQSLVNLRLGIGILL